MKSILITGASGFIGNSLFNFFSQDYKTAGTYFSSQNHLNDKNFLKVDITDKKSVEKISKTINPDIIIHAAAMKDIKQCEQNKDVAYAINVNGTKNIAAFAKDNNSFLVYISTDYIFEGTNGPYKEEDIANPATFYGKTKLEAEQSVKKLLKNFAICRSSGVYALYQKNILLFILDNLKNNKKENYFTDMYNSPTCAINFNEMVAAVIEKNLNGTFHCAGSERINRYDFALKVADIFSYDKSLIVPVELGEEQRKKELRPFDVSLDITKTQKILNMRFNDVEEGLMRIKQRKEFVEK